MKMLPCARFTVLLAESQTAVIVGGVVVPPPPPPPPVVPPVVIEPAPVKVRVMPDWSVPDPEPVMEGNEPVAPAYVPVPPVIVAEPLPEVDVPVNNDAGAVRVPVRVPPDSVMVNGALTLAPVMLVSEIVDVNVPVPMPCRVAVPVAVDARADGHGRRHRQRCLGRSCLCSDA